MKTALGHDGAASALIPPEFTNKPLIEKLCLFDSFTNSNSDYVDFQITLPGRNRQVF
ncbi:MAG: hypothetical protein ABSC54_00425 [Smithellaceae bacterium]